MTTNVDTGEISRFEALAAQWWDARGEMAPLHVINPVRLRYIEQNSGRLRGKSVLDVGCGGGILTEALARSGAHAVGIDLAKASIDIAIEHAQAQALNIDYRCIGTELLADETPASFDVVCCMEMLEHVPDPSAIVRACATLVKPGGKLFFSTINRNPKAYLFAVLGAEYVLRLLPKGTHDYAKFITPAELAQFIRNAGLELDGLKGMGYNPLTKIYSLNQDTSVNYLVAAHRPL